MKKLLLTLLLSPLSSITFGSEWLHLFNTEAYFLDLESLKPVNRFNKDLSKGWVKIEIIKDIEKDRIYLNVQKFHFNLAIMPQN